MRGEIVSVPGLDYRCNYQEVAFDRWAVARTTAEGEGHRTPAHVSAVSVSLRIPTLSEGRANLSTLQSACWVSLLLSHDFFCRWSFCGRTDHVQGLPKRGAGLALGGLALCDGIWNSCPRSNSASSPSQA